MLLPTGSATVSVSLLIASTFNIPAGNFMDPIVPGHELMSGPDLSFFIEHIDSKTKATRRLVFDLGIRKDFENSAPVIQEQFAGLPPDSGVFVKVDKDVATQLTDAGIALNTIEAIIWSHSHFDHTGDPSTFPNTTALIIGPGTTAKFLPGYPTNLNSTLLDSDFANRTVTEIGFNTTNLTIAGFKAHDYFGDGSLHLLDAPGHITGHMGALARVTNNPPTYVYMAGDTCHHPAQFRPSSLDFIHDFPCPAAFLASHPVSPQYFGGKDGADLTKRTTPLLEIHDLPPPSGYEDPATAKVSASKMAHSLDSSEDVFVVIAHDPSLIYASPNSTIRGGVKMFPETMNDWKKEGWKNPDKIWAFLQKDNPGYRFRPTNDSSSL